MTKGTMICVRVNQDQKEKLRKVLHLFNSKNHSSLTISDLLISGVENFLKNNSHLLLDSSNEKLQNVTKELHIQ